MPHNARFIGSYTKMNQIPNDNKALIAFAGRSNVGKSSLLNKLVSQRKLARTSKTPGRTRLLNFFLIDERYYFVDLPGYGYAKASVNAIKHWGKMVNNFLEKSEDLKAMLLLFDCRREPNKDDLMLLEWVESRNIKHAIVLTKTDKLSKSNLMKKNKQLSDILKADIIPFSSVTGSGQRELWKWIESAIY